MPPRPASIPAGTAEGSSPLNSQERKPHPTLARGSVILAGSFAIATLLRLSFNIVVVRQLDPSEYGMLGVGQALLMILGLIVGAAFPWAVVRFVSRGRRDVFKTCLAGNVILGIIVCSALYAAYALGFLGLEASYYPILVVVIATTLIMSAGNSFLALLQSAFRFAQVGTVRSLSALALAVGGPSLVALGFGTSGALAGFGMASLVVLGLGVYFARDLRSWAGGWTNRDVYLFALPLLVGVVNTQLLMNVDILGVKFFSGDEADTMAGYYQSAAVLARMPVFVILATMAAFFPFIARYAGDKERVTAYSSQFIRYAFVFILPLNLVLAVAPAQVLTTIFPPPYAQAGNALAMLSAGMFLLALVAILASLFQAVGRPQLPALVLSVTVGLQLILLYLLVPRYGLVGAAGVTAISSGLGLLVLMARYVRTYGPPFRPTDLLKIGVASLLLVTLLVVLPLDNRPLVFAGAALGYGLYVLALTFLRFLDASDVELILSAVLPRSSKFLRRAVLAAAIINRGHGRR